MKILILLLLLCSLNSSGQRIGTDKIDDFDGSRTIQTEVTNIGKGESVYFSASITVDTSLAQDTIYTFYFGVLPRTYTSVSLGTKIIFLFADGTKLETTNMSTHAAYKDDILSPFILLRTEDIEAFLQKKVKKIRFETSAENIDRDLSEKKTDYFMNSLSLLLKRLI